MVGFPLGEVRYPGAESRRAASRLTGGGGASGPDGGSIWLEADSRVELDGAGGVGDVGEAPLKPSRAPACLAGVYKIRAALGGWYPRFPASGWPQVAQI